MQTNSLFDNVYYYFNLLSHVETLKQKAEYQVLADDVPQEQLKEIINMRNRIFIGLLRCGLSYEYIQDADDPEKDKIRFTIDNINYDCFVKSIKNILKNDFIIFIKEAAKYEERIEKKNNDLLIQVHNKDTKNTLDKTNIKKTKDLKKQISVTEKQPDIDSFTNVSNKENTNIDNANSQNQINDFNESLDIQDNISQEQSILEEITNKNILLEKEKNHYETTKDIKTFLYDIVTIEIFQPGATVGDKMILNIMPLKIEENNVRPEIAVSISSLIDNQICDTQVFVSKETSAIQLEYKGYQLLVRGTFKNGKFSSYVIASGTTAAIGCGINNETIKIRANDNINYGHICFKKNDATIHALPLTSQNESDGFAHFMVCVEENNRYKVFQNIESSAISIDLFEKTHLNLKAYFVEDYFSVIEV